MRMVDSLDCCVYWSCFWRNGRCWCFRYSRRECCHASSRIVIATVKPQTAKASYLHTLEVLDTASNIHWWACACTLNVVTICRRQSSLIWGVDVKGATEFYLDKENAPKVSARPHTNHCTEGSLYLSGTYLNWLHLHAKLVEQYPQYLSNIECEHFRFVCQQRVDDIQNLFGKCDILALFNHISSQRTLPYWPAHRPRLWNPYTNWCP